MEGIYHFNDEYFWESLLDNEIEYANDEGMSVDEFAEKFNFVSEDDLKEIKKIYEEKLIENK